MNDKIIHERCIGYQRDIDSLNGICKQVLENGVIQWNSV